MNNQFLRSVVIILIGIIIGAVIGYFLRQLLIGEILGIALGIKVGGVSNWKTGAVYGAIIGAVVVGSIGPLVTVVGGKPPLTIYIADSISGMVVGAIIGGLTCKIFKSTKSWIW
jgi:hypothetical protein